MKQSIAEGMMELQELRRRLRAMESDVQRRADAAQPLQPDDERKLIELQSRADSVYREGGRLAPSPQPLEHPREYRVRLAEGLKEFSPDLQGCQLARMDDASFAQFEGMLYEGARKNGKSHGLRSDEIRPVPIRENGHDMVVFIGGKNAHFIKTFSRDVRRAQMKSPDAYNAMSRDANLSRIEEVVRSAHRPIVQAPRASF